MPDTSTASPSEQPQEGTQTTGSFTESAESDSAKTYSADYVERLRKEAATHRLKAKANAEAAKKLAELEDRDKTESEKAAAKIASLEEELPSARAEAFREAAVAFGGVSREDADLFLVGTDIETLTKQAERLAKSDKRKQNHVPTEGTNQQPTPDERRAWARSVFGGNE